MFEYRKAVVRKAVARFTKRLSESRDKMIGFILQTSIILGILFFVPWFGSLHDEARLVAAFVASVVISTCLYFVWDLICAPAEIWGEQREKLHELTLRLTPMLKAVALNGGRPVRWNVGAVHRSQWTGKAQTVITGSVEFLGFECRNDTDTLLQNCEAHLVSLKPENRDDDTFGEAVDLRWLLVGDSTDHYTQIPPGARRKLPVAALVGNKPVLISTRLPLAYQTIFDSGENFIGKIIVVQSFGGATAIGFRIRQDDGAPIIELLGEPKGLDVDNAESMEALSA
jgi:hypothetical protein